ncbi:MAG TPA: MarR family transcriptional regulator [Actinomycetes bacterium]
MSERAQGVAPPSADLRLVQEVSWLMIRMTARLQANFAAIAAEAGLSATQAKLLMQLQPSEALPMRVLAERLAYDPSNLTGVADKLEQRGAVERRPDPDDRRVKALAVTAEGVRLRDAFWERLVSDPGPLGHLSRAQLTRLEAALVEALGPADGS